MKTIFAVAAMAVTLAASPAFADATGDVYAANTVIATAPNGAALKFQFNPGGAYTMKAGDQTVAGTWAVENGQFCLTPAGGAKGCSPHAANRKIGDVWSVAGADGVQYSVTIVAGR